jgi:hypothetical protein
MEGGYGGGIPRRITGMKQDVRDEEIATDITDGTTMVAHLAVARCRTGRCGAFSQDYQTSLLAIARSSLGYRGVYMLVDYVAGRALTLTLWDTAQDARAYQESAPYQRQLAILSDDLVAPVGWDLYDVMMQA